ncbi:MAG: DUF2919 family protein [Pseudomonadota bacterium]
MMLEYPPDAYDRNLALKPPPLLILVMLYCALPLLLILLAYNPSPKMQGMYTYLQHFESPLSLLCGLPAALVLFAWAKRLPQAGATWRQVWRWGRWLLSLSLLAHFTLLFSQRGMAIWNTFVLLDADRLVVVNMGLDLLALYYLWRVRRVADVFADFPAPPRPA